MKSLNSENTHKLPVYARLTIILIGIIALIAILYLAADIIVPLVFATIIAILLQPVVKFLVKRRFNRILAIIVVMVVAIILVAALLFFIISQAILFAESWPVVVDKATEALNQAMAWISQKLNINDGVIKEMVANAKQKLIFNSGSEIGKTLLSMGNTLIIVFLVPVYIFTILYYEPLLLEFIKRLSGEKNLKDVMQIIIGIKTVIQGYLVGLILEIGIVTVLNTSVLLILGIEYAVLLGIIGGILNIIPYIGGLIAVALPMMIALSTKDSSWYAVYVMIGYYLVQIIDNNLIVPKIVASKVKINVLFSLIVVIAGNSLWGIPGMFLSIPLLAIIKLIFDHIEPLKPWGFLLGDTIPSSLGIK